MIDLGPIRARLKSILDDRWVMRGYGEFHYTADITALLAEVERLREQVATARRDGAIEALEAVAKADSLYAYEGSDVAHDLRERIAQLRAEGKV